MCEEENESSLSQKSEKEYGVVEKKCRNLKKLYIDNNYITKI